MFQQLSGIDTLVSTAGCGGERGRFSVTGEEGLVVLPNKERRVSHVPTRGNAYIWMLGRWRPRPLFLGWRPSLLDSFCNLYLPYSDLLLHFPIRTPQSSLSSSTENSRGAGAAPNRSRCGGGAMYISRPAPSAGWLSQTGLGFWGRQTVHGGCEPLGAGAQAG